MVVVVLLAMLMIVELFVLFLIFWLWFGLAYHDESIFNQLSDFFSFELSGLGFFFTGNIRWGLSSFLWSFFVLWFIAGFFIRSSVIILATSVSVPSSITTSASTTFSFLILVCWFSSLSVTLSWVCSYRCSLGWGRFNCLNFCFFSFWFFFLDRLRNLYIFLFRFRLGLSNSGWWDLGCQRFIWLGCFFFNL